MHQKWVKINLSVDRSPLGLKDLALAAVVGALRRQDVLACNVSRDDRVDGPSGRDMTWTSWHLVQEKAIFVTRGRTLPTRTIVPRTDTNLSGRVKGISIHQQTEIAGLERLEWCDGRIVVDTGLSKSNKGKRGPNLDEWHGRLLCRSRQAVYGMRSNGRKE